MSRGLKIVGALVLAACAIGASPGTAGEFVGLDPYNRPVFADPGPFPIVPSRVTGPVFRRSPGTIGGPLVTGPLYYAEPSPVLPGLYREDPAVASGDVLAFDVGGALAAAELARRPAAAARAGRPAPFTGDWFRYCEARYRSFDRDSGTFQPHSGPRRLCR